MENVADSDVQGPASGHEAEPKPSPVGQAKTGLCDGLAQLGLGLKMYES